MKKESILFHVVVMTPQFIIRQVNISFTTQLYKRFMENHH